MAKVKQRTIQRRKNKATWARVVADSFNGDPLSGMVFRRPKRSFDDFKRLLWCCVGLTAIVIVTGILATQYSK